MGKSRNVIIAIVVLGIIIASALFTWGLTFFRYFEEGNTFGDVVSAVRAVIENETTAIREAITERRAAAARREAAEARAAALEAAALEAASMQDLESGNRDEEDAGNGTVDSDNSIEHQDDSDDIGRTGAYAPSPDDTVADLSAAYPDIYKELNTIAEEYGSAAVSLAVYDGEKGQYYSYTYGYADISESRKVTPATKYYVASLTKLVTAICVMTLADKNHLDLDEDVSVYFGYEVRNPNFPDTRITARMLLQHTSSIFDSGAFDVSRDRGSSESVKYLIERGSSFRRNRPGTNYEYSNFGYAVLGALCERVSGKMLDAYARDAVFNPLGIDAAYVPANLRDKNDIGVIYDSAHRTSRSVEAQLDVSQSDTLGHDLHLAHGNLTVSAVDYAKILSLFGSGGEISTDERVLLLKTVYEIHMANVEGPGYMQGLATRYSDSSALQEFGNFTGSEGFYWHTGSSYGIYSQYMYNIDPNRGVVVVTSGASISRLGTGMIDVCTRLSQAAWKIFIGQEE